MKFGEKLKYLRKLRGMTQEDLISRTGLSRSYISELENNNRNPSLPTLEKFASVFGVDKSYLINENATTIDEIAKATGNEMSEDLMEFVLKQKNLPYVMLAKKLEESNISHEHWESLIQNYIDAVKQTRGK